MHSPEGGWRKLERWRGLWRWEVEDGDSEWTRAEFCACISTHEISPAPRCFHRLCSSRLGAGGRTLSRSSYPTFRHVRVILYARYPTLLHLLSIVMLSGHAKRCMCCCRSLYLHCRQTDPCLRDCEMLDDRHSTRGMSEISMLHFRSSFHAYKEASHCDSIMYKQHPK